METQHLKAMLDDLRKPFHPSRVEWKPGAVKGERALAMPYADIRAYMDRLDEVCAFEWAVSYQPWGPDRIICNVTVAGVTRSSTGESSTESERNEIGGTVAEAQAFKRACAMFGLGRYLYNLPTTWADFDPKTKQFTEQAKAKLTNMLVQHYRRAGGGPPEAPAAQEDRPFDDKSPQGTPAHERFWGQGKSAFGNDWDAARAWLIEKYTTAKTPGNVRTSAADLSDAEKDALADAIKDNLARYQAGWKAHKAANMQSNGVAHKQPA